MKLPASIILRACVCAFPAGLFCGCAISPEMVSLGIDDYYAVERMRKLPLYPAFTGERYSWRVYSPSGEIADSASTREYIFLGSEEGDYRIEFDIIDAETPYHHELTVRVVHEEVEYSPYISRVYEYQPAPGQFVNEMPMYEPGDTEADMIRKAEESISGTNDIMISLGGFGGYVTFGFDHTVVNIPGEADFRIWGNAFYELTQPDAKGGSAEPGIVMVSYDSNCNGLPDDPWYELAGSEYSNPLTRHGYSITYFRPNPLKDPAAGTGGFITDAEYIPWQDSEGSAGFIARNAFHLQEYWPQWIEESTLTFRGSLLPANAEDLSGSGTYYVLYSYPWGYADNHPNDEAELNSFDISWAVDDNGHPVMLPGIDFVRVYTGLNQYCGWLGESSTEICRAADLHIPLPQIPQ